MNYIKKGKYKMSWFSGIVMYIIIWWVVVFGVLPMGHNPKAESDEDGIAGAPMAPDLKKKFIITTIVSFLIWGIVFALISADIYDFREWAKSW